MSCSEGPLGLWEATGLGQREVADLLGAALLPRADGRAVSAESYPGTWRGERRVTSSGGGGGRSWERNAVPSAPRSPSQPGPGPGPPERAEADGEQQLSGQAQGLGLRCPSPNSVLCASQRLTDSPSHASGSRLEHG